MSDDPYSTLGVSKTASQEEIRKAYRKLAKDSHPDLHPGDQAAEERFKAVSAAYRILEDPERRARYDRGEIDESGAERPQYKYYREYADAGGARHYESTAAFEDFADASEIFSDLFRRARRAPSKGPDVRYHLKIDFLDAVNGVAKRVTMPDGGALVVTIPPGVQSGQILRLKGKGMPGIDDMPAGDALVEIEVGEHSIFARDGDDIIVELPITIDEAALGGKVQVPTITGRVSVSIPTGAQTDQVLRLPGKGVASGDTRTSGDQLVRLRVVMPPTVDPELAEFLMSWRETHSYDPRGF